jgi:hypothetical protein
VPLRHLLAYGALGLPLAMAALPVYVHVPRLYAEAAGMSLSLLGALLLAARLLDAGIDPLLGGWSDRTPSRRRLIGIALPCLALGMLALLHPPAVAAPLCAAGFAAVYLFRLFAGQRCLSGVGRRARPRCRRAYPPDCQSRGFRSARRVIAPRRCRGCYRTILPRDCPAWRRSFHCLLLLLASWTFLGAPPSVARPRATGNFFADLCVLCSTIVAFGAC